MFSNWTRTYVKKQIISGPRNRPGSNLRCMHVGGRPAEVRQIRTGILLPAVSPISQRRPDYIKSLNPGLRPKPAVQVLSRGRGGRGGNKPTKTEDGIGADVDDGWHRTHPLSRRPSEVSGGNRVLKEVTLEPGFILIRSRTPFIFSACFLRSCTIINCPLTLYSSLRSLPCRD